MRIILVDDDKGSLKSLDKFLTYAGIEVDTFDSPVDLLSSIKIGKEYGFIISDYKMPHHTGIELINKIKTIYPKIKSIIYTGYDNKNILKEMKSNNIEFFFKKPINLSKLITILNEGKEYEK